LHRENPGVNIGSGMLKKTASEARQMLLDTRKSGDVA
jgi:hypothetical protein